MAANPSLYADAFAHARSPAAVFQTASSRITVQRALAADLASLLRERAHAEDAYARALHKITARLHAQGKDQVCREAALLPLDARQQDRILGDAWANLRRTFELDLQETARVHDRWRQKIEAEVEVPLRASLDQGDWARWSAAENSMAANIREYESLVDRVSKAQAKSTKSGKSASSKQLQSQSALASLGSSLTAALPAFLSQSQALDLVHGAFLKECLVRCGTHTSDLGRERMEAGERLLNQVLAVDEGAEAEEWALREGIRLGGAGGGGRNGASLAPVGEFGETASSNGAGGGRSESLLDRDDAASTVSGATGVSRARTTSRAAASAPPPPAAPLPLPTPRDDARSERSREKSGSKLGGKFASILGGGSRRDRSSSIPNSAKYANFAAGSDAPPVPASSPGLAPAPTMERRDTAASGASSTATGATGGDLLGGRAAGAGGAPLSPPLQPEPSARDKRKSLMPTGPGGLFRRASRATVLSDGESAAPAAPPPASQFAQSLSEEPMGRVDDEGYSLPPQGYDRAIGESAGVGATTASRNLMDEEDEDDVPLVSSVPKLQIAPSTLPPSSPTLPQEDESARLAALESVKSALGAPAAGLGRRATTNRGRRGTAPSVPERQDSAVSATASASASASGVSEDDTPLAQVAERHNHRRAPPPPPVGRAAAAPENPALATSPALSSPTPPAGRAMSVLSATSSFGAGPGAGAVPGSVSARTDPFADAAGPGLRVSVTESVSALYKGGEVTRALVTGEVALSHRLPASSPSATKGADPMRLRITGLEHADKTAPNAAFLAPTAGAAAGAGEFTLAAAFAPATAGTTTAVLKYALSGAASARAAPLRVTPTWRVEPGQARAIVAYEIARDSPLLVGGGAQLEDVRVELHLAQGTVTAFQAKPHGAAELLPGARGVVFTLGAIGPSTEAGKLLVSLQIDGGAVAQPAPVAVRWVARGATAAQVAVEVVDNDEGVRVEETRSEAASGKYLAA
ncbi:hypothetical protein JCM3770_000521 [Rhodotorula araucariae]